MFSVRYAAGQFDFLHTMAFAQTNAHREAMHRLLRSLLCVCSLLDSERVLHTTKELKPLEPEWTGRRTL